MLGPPIKVVQKPRTTVKLINVPGYTVEEAKDLPQGSILISIQEEYGPPPDIGHITCPILAIQFSDITEILETENGNDLHPLTKEQATQILEFVEFHEKTAELCIVHCAAGISRSAAIVLSLHTLYDWPLPKEFWRLSSPNPSTLGTLITTAKHGCLEEGPNAIQSARSWRKPPPPKTN